MSRNFSVDLTLIATHNNKNILKILETGRKIGFTYYDHEIAKTYEDSPIITPSQTLKKILNAAEFELEDGPTVFINCGDSNFGFLSFHDDNHLLKCSFWGMRPIIRKTFEENIVEIDFEFYIQLMLKLCHGFAIKHIELGEF